MDFNYRPTSPLLSSAQIEAERQALTSGRQRNALMQLQVQQAQAQAQDQVRRNALMQQQGQQQARVLNDLAGNMGPPQDVNPAALMLAGFDPKQIEMLQGPKPAAPARPIVLPDGTVLSGDGRQVVREAPKSAAGGKIGAINPESWTPQSLAAYQQSGDPSVLRRFAPPSSGGARPSALPDVGDEQAALARRFGKPPANRRWKTDGSLEVIPGSADDRKTNEQLAGKETVDTVIAKLRQSYDTLSSGGGITSTQQGALGNVAAAISRSGPGQFIGGAVGTQNQKERDAIAQTRPILLQAIMKATGMSAKQMDSNAELKLYLATATDPTLSLEANREALDMLERLYGSGSQAPSAPAAPPAAKPAAAKQVVRTGTLNGRKVVQYSDGSTAYAD
jgi:hypothetical protein